MPGGAKPPQAPDRNTASRHSELFENRHECSCELNQAGCRYVGLSGLDAVTAGTEQHKSEPPAILPRQADNGNPLCILYKSGSGKIEKKFAADHLGGIADSIGKSAIGDVAEIKRQIQFDQIKCQRRRLMRQILLSLLKMTARVFQMQCVKMC